VSTIINPKVHTFAAALACKRDNDTLSTKTLKKLTLIANREFGGDATRVFGKTSPGIGRFNGDAAGLRNAISSQLLNVRSPQLANVMRQWLAQLPSPNAQATGACMQSAIPHADAPQNSRMNASSGVVSPEIPPPDYSDTVEIPPPDYLDNVELPPLDYPGAAQQGIRRVATPGPVEPKSVSFDSVAVTKWFLDDDAGNRRGPAVPKGADLERALEAQFREEQLQEG
jgi:hypothetical protein